MSSFPLFFRFAMSVFSASVSAMTCLVPRLVSEKGGFRGLDILSSMCAGLLFCLALICQLAVSVKFLFQDSSVSTTSPAYFPYVFCTVCGTAILAFLILIVLELSYNHPHQSLSELLGFGSTESSYKPLSTTDSNDFGFGGVNDVSEDWELSNFSDNGGLNDNVDPDESSLTGIPPPIPVLNHQPPTQLPAASRPSTFEGLYYCCIYCQSKEQLPQSNMQQTRQFTAEQMVCMLALLVTAASGFWIGVDIGFAIHSTVRPYIRCVLIQTCLCLSFATLMESMCVIEDQVRAYMGILLTAAPIGIFVGGLLSLIMDNLVVSKIISFLLRYFGGVSAALSAGMLLYIAIYHMLPLELHPINSESLGKDDVDDESCRDPDLQARRYSHKQRAHFQQNVGNPLDLGYKCFALGCGFLFMLTLYALSYVA